METKTTFTITREEWARMTPPIETRPLSADEGGGYIAMSPLLGGAMFVGDGETEAEAISDFESRRLRLYDKVFAAR